MYNMNATLCFLTTTILAASTANAIKLNSSTVHIDYGNVIIAGHDNTADFAHQFHIAFSSMIKGSCIFSGQPFHCAVTKFSQDPPTFSKDHCKLTPDVVDVGSLVDFPRRNCGQNPITKHNCFDDVDYMKSARVFLSRNDKTDIKGSVENTVALLAQLIEDPENSIKFLVNNNEKEEEKHIMDINNCLQHVYNLPWIEQGIGLKTSWYVFDQTEFLYGNNDEGSIMSVGFQNNGWIYIPERCKKNSGDQVCKLVIRPDKCEAPTTFGNDAAIYSNFAERNAMIILQPCLGGKVDTKKYPHAPDIVNGKLDVYGQLTNNYAEQSAPQMQIIGRMIRQLIGISSSTKTNMNVDGRRIKNPNKQKKKKKSEQQSNNNNILSYQYETMPILDIDKGKIMVAGCSNTADFSHQFHVAFSSIVSGSCIFSGMPFHCAVTRFNDDYMVPKTPSTSAGIHCDGCDDNNTLIYDHCKNHPFWVDIGVLQNYAETANNVDDPKIHLANAKVFAFQPTHDRCYQPPAMELIYNFHLKYVKDKSQIKLVQDQPFPHTLPTNSTPYFNDEGNFTGAGYDGPGECLNHIFGDENKRLWAAPKVNLSWWHRINTSEFVLDKGVGMKSSAWLFYPPQCSEIAITVKSFNNNDNRGSSDVEKKCKLLILPGGCNDITPPMGGSDSAFAKYANDNNIVILKPCQGGIVDQTRFPENHENLRGMVDVYGQLSADYATRRGDQMEPIGKMMKRLIGMNDDDGWMPQSKL